MAGDANFLFPTAGRPFLPVGALEGISLKPLNTIPDQHIWSAILRIESGMSLPSRNHDALCEMLVVAGRGRYDSGPSLIEGDYLREDAGDYAAIRAEETLELFITHHGACAFSLNGGPNTYDLGQEQMVRLMASNIL